MDEFNAMIFSYNVSALFSLSNSPNTIPKGLYTATGSMRGSEASFGMSFYVDEYDELRETCGLRPSL